MKNVTFLPKDGAQGIPADKISHLTVSLLVITREDELKSVSTNR